MMKYTRIRVCPVTKEQLSKRDVMYNGGVCARCGHDDHSTISHYENVVGHWERPGLIDRLFRGKKDKFIPKEAKP